MSIKTTKYGVTVEKKPHTVRGSELLSGDAEEGMYRSDTPHGTYILLKPKTPVSGGTPQLLYLADAGYVEVGTPTSFMKFTKLEGVCLTMEVIQDVVNTTKEMY